MKLIDYMIEQNLKEHQVAAAIGVAQGTVNKLKRGKCWPKREIAQRILEWSNGKVTPNDMMMNEVKK